MAAAPVPALPEGMSECPAHGRLVGWIENTFAQLQRLENAIQRLGTTMTDKLDHMADEARISAVSAATLELRVRFLEKLVYGAVGLGLTGLLVAILSLVIHKP